MLLADAGTPAATPDELMLDAARRAGTNVAASSFVPSRPPPQAQGTNGASNESKSHARSQGDGPSGTKEDISFNVNAAVFFPGVKSPTVHNHSDSPRIAATRVRPPDQLLK